MDRFYVKDFGDGSLAICERWGVDVGEDRCVCDFQYWNDPRFLERAEVDAETVCALMNAAGSFPVTTARGIGRE